MLQRNICKWSIYYTMNFKIFKLSEKCGHHDLLFRRIIKIVRKVGVKAVTFGTGLPLCSLLALFLAPQFQQKIPVELLLHSLELLGGEDGPDPLRLLTKQKIYELSKGL